MMPQMSKPDIADISNGAVVSGTAVNSMGGALRAAYPKALATLTRLLGGLDVAEDALQEAIVRALSTWPRDGVPDNTVAWLVTTARRRAIDGFRRQKLAAGHAEAVRVVPEARVAPEETALTDALTQTLRDDLLRLVFTCCHPALSQSAQVALTLKTVGGLSVDEIARAYLVSPKTMEQRLTRAKRKIRDAGIPYEVPRRDDLEGRSAAVLAAIYLIFNEGYSALGEPGLVRADLCHQAIRLGRLLTRLFVGEPEAEGLLALMLLQHSRSAARLDGDGNLVTLDEQNRSAWDQAAIGEGRVLVEKALRRGRPGPYQIEAAIAAVHCEAAHAEDTDWRHIAMLYWQLEGYREGPIVTLNRAVAVAKVNGPAAGLALLDEIAGLTDMKDYHYFHAARGALLAEHGDAGQALAAYETALGLAANPAEQAYIKARMAALPGK